MLVVLLVFFVGASLGSFLLVWAERGSFWKAAKGRSICAQCHREIRACHLIPVVGWVVLHGRCDHCKAPIPLLYLLFEVGLGLALVVLWGDAFGFGVEFLTASARDWSFFLRDAVFTLVFAFLFVEDYRWKLLPDRVTIPAVALAMIWNTALGLDVFNLVLGMGFVGGFFLIQYAISRGAWVGGGDIRFGMLLGALLGFAGGIVALFLAYVFGALAAIILLARGMATRKTAIPFGTFLAVGGYAALLWGEKILLML